VLLLRRDGLGQDDNDRRAWLDYVNERKAVAHRDHRGPDRVQSSPTARRTINQREIGIDCLDFKIALRALVREKPGPSCSSAEMRDKGDLRGRACTAAEDGPTWCMERSTPRPRRRRFRAASTACSSRKRSSRWRAHAGVPDGARLCYQKLLPNAAREDPHASPALEIMITTTRSCASTSSDGARGRAGRRST